MSAFLEDMGASNIIRRIYELRLQLSPAHLTFLNYGTLYLKRLVKEASSFAYFLRYMLVK